MSKKLLEWTGSKSVTGSVGFGSGYGGPYSGTASPAYKPCHHSHQPLALVDGLVVHGGSCVKPTVKDCDIYIGFDLGMTFTDRSYPWVAGEEVFYQIQDQKAPGDLKQFRAMIAWAEIQLRAGKKIHMGCIGGHGRTGTALAALVSEMDVSDDAIAYVRKNYCERAVESAAQVDFLVKHFGVKTADTPEPRWYTGSKSKKKGKGRGADKETGWIGGPTVVPTGTATPNDLEHPEGAVLFRTGEPLRRSWDIWGVGEV